jgi:hypothetical protein
MSASKIVLLPVTCRHVRLLIVRYLQPAGAPPLSQHLAVGTHTLVVHLQCMCEHQQSVCRQGTAWLHAYYFSRLADTAEAGAAPCHHTNAEQA